MVDGVDLLRQIDLIDGHAVFAVSSSTGLRRPKVEWFSFSLGTHRRGETLLGRDWLGRPNGAGRRDASAIRPRRSPPPVVTATERWVAIPKGDQLLCFDTVTFTNSSRASDFTIPAGVSSIDHLVVGGGGGGGRGNGSSTNTSSNAGPGGAGGGAA